MPRKIAADRALALRAAVNFIPGRFGRYSVRTGDTVWEHKVLPTAVVVDCSRPDNRPYLLLGPNYAAKLGPSARLLLDFSRMFSREGDGSSELVLSRFKRVLLRTRASQVSGDSLPALDLLPTAGRLFTETDRPGNRYRARYLYEETGLALSRGLRAATDPSAPEPAPDGALLGGHPLAGEAGTEDADIEGLERWRECANCGYEYDHQDHDECPDCGYNP
jgi:hypothetical protein